MLGFALPLLLLTGFQALLGLSLLAPAPLCKPAIALAKATRTPIGLSIVGTLSAVLVTLLASPLYDLVQLSHQQGSTGEAREDKRTGQAMAQLNLVLTAASLLYIYVLRKLGLVLAERDLLRVSQQAMLRQVEGLTAEYNRITKDGVGARGASEPQGPQLKAQLEAARQELAAAKEAQEAAQAAKRTADANVEALRTQAKGLENEYDRLLAEMDELRRRLRRTDPTYTEGAPASKRD